MSKLLSLLIVALLLTACGGASPTPAADLPAEEPAAVEPTAPPAEPTATPEPVPTATAEPEPTAITPAAVVEDIPQEVRKMYLNLMMLEVSATMMEDAAAKIKSGELEGFESFGVTIAIGALLKAANDNFNTVEPVDFLQPAWDEAKVVAPQVQAVLGRWIEQEITSDDIPGEIEALREPIAGVMILADEALASEYGVTPEALTEMRAEALKTVQDSMDNPPE